MYKTRTFPVLKRIVPSLHKRAARIMWRGKQGVVRREGALFLLNLNYNVDRFILLEGVDEPEQRKYFFDQLRQRKCDAFIDLGSNIGTYTVFAALQTDCTSVYAFEPSPQCYDRLRTHLLLNGISDRVTTRNAAVSDHNGTVPFSFCANNTDLFSKVDEKNSSGNTVPCVRLDDEVKLAGRKIAIKMDIEGYELTALQGMKELLRNNNCFLQIECWAEKAEAFITAMKAEGYRLINQIKEDHYFEKSS